MARGKSIGQLHAIAKDKKFPNIDIICKQPVQYITCNAALLKLIGKSGVQGT